MMLRLTLALATKFADSGWSLLTSTSLEIPPMSLSLMLKAVVLARWSISIVSFSRFSIRWKSVTLVVSATATGVDAPISFSSFV